ncbi:hypothetical protein QR680_015627 [Steinernema hermaphroditum]|nr:hypothetical protein QR680_015619 [Steinernema hermaphroditum]KAK0401163.1 hypothetical protein QR680_015623 [Steinernema hermaphroditum]KAK0401176.1 hypothetical protein QR680_015627 [Steinernema hermaphroditum]
MKDRVIIGSSLISRTFKGKTIIVIKDRTAGTTINIKIAKAIDTMISAQDNQEDLKEIATIVAVKDISLVIAVVVPTTSSNKIPGRTRTNNLIKTHPIDGSTWYKNPKNT